jgi:hypothetical protein
MTTLWDAPFSADASDGWSLADANGGTVTRVADASPGIAGVGENQCLSFNLPAGFPGTGVAPGSARLPNINGITFAELLNGQTGYREVFLGIHVKRPSTWEVAPAGVNKDVFFWGYNPPTGFATGETTIPYVTRETIPASDSLLLTPPWLSPNIVGAPGASGGVFGWGDGTNGSTWPNQAAATSNNLPHGSIGKREIYIRFASSGAATDGLVRHWINGVLVAEYSGAAVHFFMMTRFYIEPTYGGGSGTPTVRADNYSRYWHPCLAAR